MTTKADYTAEEWEVLLRAPVVVGLAVVAASPSGPIGVVQEMSAIGRILGEEPQGAETPAQSLEELKAHALQTCREVSALLARKAPASEADSVKRWLLTVARRVAEAAKEGGVLGIGGVRVSAAEQATLAEVAAVLEVAL